MINISSEFARELYNDNRNYIVRVEITLLDQTHITVNQDKLWGGSLKIEDSVSDDSHLEVGSVIINQLTVELNNIYDDFSQYDFTGAVLVPYVGLQLSNSTEMLKKGVFTADEVKYNGSLISIKAIDNMAKFDKEGTFSNNIEDHADITFPATLYQIVTAACSKCGVAFNTHDFPHKDYIVETAPSEKAVTFRECIAYAAQIACCFARCNVNGYLEFKWYNTLALDWQSEVVDGGYFDDGEPYYESGDNIEGGVFNPWDDESEDADEGDYDGGLFGDRDKIHFITSTYAFDLGVDDIVITGVRVTAKTKVVTNTGDEDGGNIMVSQTNGCSAAMNARKTNYETELTLLQLKIIKLKNKKKKSKKQKRQLHNLESEYEVLNAKYHEYMTSEDWSTLSELERLSASYESAAKQYGEDSPQALAALGELGESYSSAQFDPDTFTLESVSVYLQERDATVSYLAGDEGYVIEISEENAFITEYTAQEIAYWIGEKLIGVTYRRGTVSHQNDPSIEAGDIALVWHTKRTNPADCFPILISTTTFEVGSKQNTRSAGETPARNSAKTYSELTKSYVEKWDMLEEEKTDRQVAEENLNNALQAKAGLYSTEEDEGQGTIFYLHDKPRLEDSMVVWKMTAEAWGVSTDGMESWNAGMTVDGDTIVRILTATGVSADWIKTGAFSISKKINGTLYELFYADCDTGVLRIDGRKNDGSSMFKLDTANGTFTLNGYATEAEVAGKVDASALPSAIDSRVGSYDGISLSGGAMYINATYINAGTLSGSRIKGGEISGTNIVSQKNYSTVEREWRLNGDGLSMVFVYDGSRTSGFYIDVAGWDERKPDETTIQTLYGSLSIEAENAVISKTARGTKIGSTGKAMYISELGRMGVSSSSRRYKHDIRPISGELDPHKILDIEVVQFKFNADMDSPESERYLKDLPGFIAEDVDEHYPIAADHEKGLAEDWNERYIIPPMLALIQEQHSEIETLKAQVAVHEERISKLEEQINKLLEVIG